MCTNVPCLATFPTGFIFNIDSYFLKKGTEFHMIGLDISHMMTLLNHLEDKKKSIVQFHFLQSLPGMAPCVLLPVSCSRS